MKRCTAQAIKFIYFIVSCIGNSRQDLTKGYCFLNCSCNINNDLNINDTEKNIK